VVPELPGCSAFGQTEEAALEEVKVAIEFWLETAKREGREIPQPHGKEHLNVLYENTFRTTRPQKAGIYTPPKPATQRASVIAFYL